MLKNRLGILIVDGDCHNMHTNGVIFCNGLLWRVNT